MQPTSKGINKLPNQDLIRTTWYADGCATFENPFFANDTATEGEERREPAITTTIPMPIPISGYYKMTPTTPPMMTVQMLEDILNYNVTRNIKSSKDLDYHKMYQLGCIGLPRMPISTKESTTKEMQN